MPFDRSQIALALRSFGIPFGAGLFVNLAAAAAPGSDLGLLCGTALQAFGILALGQAGRRMADRYAPPWQTLVNHDLDRALGAAFKKGLSLLARDEPDKALRGALKNAAADSTFNARWAAINLDTDFPELAALLGPRLVLDFAELGADTINEPLGELEQWKALLSKLLPDGTKQPGVDKVAVQFQVNCHRWFLYECRADQSAQNALEAFLLGDISRELRNLAENEDDHYRELAGLAKNLSDSLEQQISSVLQAASGLQELWALRRHSWLHDRPDRLNPFRSYPSWADVLRGYTFRRALTDELLEWLKTDEHRYRQRVIVAGSGTGKTVLLMQLAVTASDAGFRVFWANRDDPDPSSVFTGSQAERVAVFVDRAARFDFRTWSERFAQSNLTVIAAEQEAVWRSHHGTADDEVHLGPLNDTEVDRLDALLCELDIPVGKPPRRWAERDVAERRRALGDPDGGGLLEILVELATGKEIRVHVEDELRRVGEASKDACLLAAWRGVADHTFDGQVLFDVVAVAQDHPIPPANCRNAVKRHSVGLLFDDMDQWRLRHRWFAEAALQAGGMRSAQMLEFWRESDPQFAARAREIALRCADMGALRTLLEETGICDPEVIRTIAWRAGRAGECGLPVLKLLLVNDVDLEVLRWAALGAGWAGDAGIPILDCLLEWLVANKVDPVVLLWAAETADLAGGRAVPEWVLTKSDVAEVLALADLGGTRPGKRGLRNVVLTISRADDPEVLRCAAAAAGGAGVYGPAILRLIAAKTDDPVVWKTAAFIAAQDGERGLPVLDWLRANGLLLD